MCRRSCTPALYRHGTKRATSPVRRVRSYAAIKLPNDTAISGERPPERSEEGRSSAALPGWTARNGASLHLAPVHRSLSTIGSDTLASWYSLSFTTILFWSGLPQESVDMVTGNAADLIPGTLTTMLAVLFFGVKACVQSRVRQ